MNIYDAFHKKKAKLKLEQDRLQRVREILAEEAEKRHMYEQEAKISLAMLHAKARQQALAMAAAPAPGILGGGLAGIAGQLGQLTQHQYGQLNQYPNAQQNINTGLGQAVYVTQGAPENAPPHPNDMLSDILDRMGVKPVMDQGYLFDHRTVMLLMQLLEEIVKRTNLALPKEIGKNDMIDALMEAQDGRG